MTDRDKRLRLVTLVAITGQLMVVLDIAAVNVALPTIRAELGFSSASVQWAASAYTITFSGFLLVGGRAADLLGRRQVFLAGLVLFTLSSMGAGLTTGPVMLITSRAVQGIGAAMLSPATLTVLLAELRDAQQRRAIGAWAAMSGVGGGAGVLLGGLMTQELSWRWIFIINVPVGVITLAIGWPTIGRTSARVSWRDLDLAGAITLTAAMTAIVLAIVQAESSSWSSPLVLITVGLAVLLSLALWVIESQFARNPLLPLRYRLPSVMLSANLVVLLLFCVVIPPWFLCSYYMQTVLGFGALQAGLAFLPQALVIALSSAVCSRIADRCGPRLLLPMGPLLAVTGMLLMWWQTSGGAHPGYVSAVLGPLVLLGLAIGSTLPSATLVATTGVDVDDVGLASGALNASRQFGGALGLAVVFTMGTQGGGGFHEVPERYSSAALVAAGIAAVAFVTAILAAVQYRPSPAVQGPESAGP